MKALRSTPLSLCRRRDGVAGARQRSGGAEVPVPVLLGPRQCGKSTPACHLLAGRKGPAASLDLERPSRVRRLRDPELSLSQ